MKKKRRLKKSGPIGLIIMSTITLLMSSIMITKSFKNSFVGTWISEGGTIYVFHKDHSGSMKTSLSEYQFTYAVKNQFISIDFEDEKNIDSDYEYSFDKNKLILKSEKGLFNFIKKVDS